MKQKLLAKGWVMYYSCMCGGTLKEYYNNPAYPDYEITARPRRQTFRILLKNHVVSGPHWGYKLEEKLTENSINGANS
jgi:hypothetical protein